MDINKIREKLVGEIINHNEWLNKLNYVEPGHYGVIDSDVDISENNIWIDIPNRKFTFQNVKFDFSLRLGSSKIEDSISYNFKKIVSGTGVFEFKDKNSIIIQEMKINMDLDLFDK